jgi:actin-like ATPase involved in cell morphogenesis/Tfp pilus assembly protein PilZ
MSGGKADRRHARYNVDWRVSLACKDWIMASKVAMANASRGGLFLLTPKPPPMGSQVALVIALPDGTKLSVTGTVVHVVTPEQALAAGKGRGPGIGVKIDAKFAADLALLESMAQSEAAPAVPAAPAASAAPPRAESSKRAPHTPDPVGMAAPAGIGGAAAATKVIPSASVSPAKASGERGGGRARSVDPRRDDDTPVGPMSDTVGRRAASSAGAFGSKSPGASRTPGPGPSIVERVRRNVSEEERDAGPRAQGPVPAVLAEGPEPAPPPRGPGLDPDFLDLGPGSESGGRALTDAIDLDAPGALGDAMIDEGPAPALGDLADELEPQDQGEDVLPKTARPTRRAPDDLPPEPRTPTVRPAPADRNRRTASDAKGSAAEAKGPAGPPASPALAPAAAPGTLGRLRPARWVVPKGDACPAIGIDFGTSYTSVSVAVDDLVYLIPDDSGRVLHPSVVSYPEKSARLTGWAARERLAHDPRHTIASAKRLLGQHHSDPSIAGYLQSLPFRTSAGPGDVILAHIDKEQLAIPQICSAMIEHARDLAERALGTRVRQAAFSIPVTYAEEQKAALRRAAQLAGLEVVGLIMEPIAGALAYGIGQERNEIVAVYDFGGGTFDFSLLDMSGDHVRVIATEGDGWLGGDDFDLALASAVADAFWRATKIELRQKVVEWQRLLMAAEQAKRDLSTDTRALLRIPHLIEAPQRIDLKQPVDRAVFEQLCQPLYDRSVEVMRAALERAGLDAADVTQVVMTGGVSRIPFIRDGLVRFFARELTLVVSPEEAIALGAGLKAAQALGHPVSGVGRRTG